ncbi:hypothetical protein LZC95_49745 [Pendulispora brunnea]|uniref:Uncharacterized protein n=1 Tax=Pendulispora brunnea TaxID=2905690 RepID=A0ABZ2K756_9BACT
MALETLAFSMLEAENELFLCARHADVKMVATWRRDVRVAAEVVRRWELRQQTGTEAEQPPSREPATSCQFCPRPAGVRITRCKWHV